MRLKKRQKKSRMHGKKMGTHGGGARKNRKGSGHRGGYGLAGTGKRSGQKITLITKLYGHDYFGKQGVTSRGTKRDKRQRINLRQIQEKHKSGEVDLTGYKILGEGDVSGKLIIKADEASKSAIEKVEAKGGKIILLKQKNPEDEEKTEEKKGKKVAKKKESKEENSDEEIEEEEEESEGE